MPIYAYRCESCGHAKDVLRKISDPVLTLCPVCGKSTFRKQVTAAGFQLKGSGWYVTDFRNPVAAKVGAKGKAEKESGTPEAASGSDKAASGNDSGSKEKASSPATSDAPAPTSDKGSSTSPSSNTPSTITSN